MTATANTGSEVLYHYCSTDSFLSIMQTRSIWLSSLSLSNDTMEGRLVNQIIMRLAERDGLDAHSLECLQRDVTFAERQFDGLGFCLSERGDLLSQWRGYADDARGVSIGFSGAYLEQLATKSGDDGLKGFTLQKVKYQPHEHESLIEPNYSALRSFIDAGVLNRTLKKPASDSRTHAEVAGDDQQIDKDQTLFRLQLLML